MFFSQVKALPEPDDDCLSSLANAPYFRDVLQAPLSQSGLVASQLQHRIFNELPDWVNALMGLRNRLVKRFGFEVGQTAMAPAADHWKVGSKAGFLTVMEISDEEVISGANDKHMSFYISVKKANNTVIISTLVNQKTLIGRVYVNAILPFHYVIARTVINNAIKAGKI